MACCLSHTIFAGDFVAKCMKQRAVIVCGCVEQIEVQPEEFCVCEESEADHCEGTGVDVLTISGCKGRC